MESKIESVLFREAYETGGFPFGYMAYVKLYDGNTMLCEITTCNLKADEVVSAENIAIDDFYDSLFDVSIREQLYGSAALDYMHKHNIVLVYPDIGYILDELVQIANDTIGGRDAIDSLNGSESVLYEPSAKINKTNPIDSFKAETDRLFHNINGMGPKDIENEVWIHIDDILAENETVAEINGLAIYGSRSRGLEDGNSDIDIVVEFSTEEKEDFLFNLLHDEDYLIGGVKVDINPITKHETGYLSDYLVNAEKYLDEKMNKVNDNYLINTSRVACKVCDRYISIQTRDGGYDYTLYGDDYKEIDSGIYNDELDSIEVLKDILSSLDVSSDIDCYSMDRLKILDYDGFMEMVDVNSYNKGFLLYMTAKHGDYHMGEYLIRHNADINYVGEKQSWGYTPLHWSASRGDIKMVSLLIQKGADVNALANDGKTPLALAYETKGKLENTEKVILKLKDYGALEKLEPAIRRGKGGR